MVDMLKSERIIVREGGRSGGYLMVPMAQLAAVEDCLRRGGIRFWTDSFAVSVNKKPEVIFIQVDPAFATAAVQALLDAEQ